MGITCICALQSPIIDFIGFKHSSGFVHVPSGFRISLLSSPVLRLLSCVNLPVALM